MAYDVYNVIAKSERMYSLLCFKLDLTSLLLILALGPDR